MNVTVNFTTMLKSILTVIRNFFIILKEFPAVELHDQRAEISEDSRIPNVCYQTWKSKKIPKTLLRSILEFRKRNADVSFILFDDNQMDSYMSESWSNHPIYEIYLRSSFGPMKTDIFRYCILYEKGGYYLDIKSGLSESLRKQHSIQTEAVFLFESNVSPIIQKISKQDFQNIFFVCNWFLAFSKNSAFLELLINNIVLHYKLFEKTDFQYPKQAIIALTGPGMLTKTFREFNFNQGSHVLINGNIDNPFQYELKGSYARFIQLTSYEEARNTNIFKDEAKL